MKQIKEKRNISEIKAAWREYVENSPQLSDYWLNIAVRNLPVLQRKQQERFSVEYFYGVAFSVLASFLIFISSNVLYQMYNQDNSNVVYMLNSHELSFFIGQ